MIRELLTKLKRRWRWRSAITGRWISKAEAEANPDTAVKERG